MISELISLAVGALKFICPWMDKYSDSENTTARVITDDKKKMDNFDKTLKQKDIEQVRKDLRG